MDVRSPWLFDRRAALSRVDDDEELLLDIVEQFLADAPETLAAIHAAIASGDDAALRNGAHSLKGSAGYLAADDLCVAAQQMECFGRARQIDAAHRAWPSFESQAREILEGLRAELSRHRA